MAMDVLDDEDDIDAEIRRQLDALHESDMSEEEDDRNEWRLESVVSGEDDGKSEYEQQNPDGLKCLPDSMVVYLTAIRGCHDERVERELQDWKQTIENVDIQSKTTDELLEEKLKLELGDQFSIKEVMMSKQVIEDMEKEECNGIETFIQGDMLSSSGDELLDQNEEMKKLQQMLLQQQEMADKRRAEFERKQEEVRENERRVEEQRKQREIERIEEQQRLAEEQKLALEKLNEELKEEMRQLERERVKHETEMAYFTAEQQKQQEELNVLITFEAQRKEEINHKAAVCIQRVYRGYSVCKWMKPLLTQKKCERLKRLEQERIWMQREADEKRRREEQEKQRKEEEERRRREEKRKEEERRSREEQQRREEQETKRIEEEKRREQERIEEEERREKEEAKRRMKVEEEERRKREEERRIRIEEERRKQMEEEQRRRQREEEERKRKQEEEERKRREEERRLLAELERQRAEDERKRRIEEQRIREEEERRQLERKRKRLEEEMKKTPEYVAAVKIQATWRGHVTRVVLWDWLPWLQKREEEWVKRNEAAIRIQALVRGVLLRKRLDEALLAAKFDDEVDDFDYDQEIDLSAFDFDQTQLDEGWGPAPTPQLPPRQPVLAPIATQSDSNLLIQNQPSVHRSPAPDPRTAWGSISRLSNNRSALSHSTPDVAHGRALSSHSEVAGGLTPLTAHPSDLFRGEKADGPSGGAGEEKISYEWGFKNAETAKIMMKRARRLKQNVLSRKKLQDPQKRLELFRKLDVTAGKPLGNVYRRRLPVERTSYFAHLAHNESSSDDSLFEAQQQVRADLTFKWVHEQFVSPPDHQSVGRSHDKQALSTVKDRNNGKSSSLSNLSQVEQGLLHLASNIRAKAGATLLSSKQTDRRYSETESDKSIKLPAIKVHSAPVRKTRNRPSNN